jgi:hypothetical protein
MDYNSNAISREHSSLPQHAAHISSHLVAEDFKPSNPEIKTEGILIPLNNPLNSTDLHHQENAA